MTNVNNTGSHAHESFLDTADLSYLISSKKYWTEYSEACSNIVVYYVVYDVVVYYVRLGPGHCELKPKTLG